MKILVTGGAGFIGSHVADAYLEAGHEVVVVDDLSTGSMKNINPKAKFYQLDICSPDLDDIFAQERPDIVNHHAAQVSVPRSIEDPLHDAKVNILGLLNILQSCVKHSIKKIIFISSGGAIYGDAKEYPTTEHYTPQPLSVYAVSKHTGEEFIRFFQHHYGLQFTVLRYANVYGPRQVSQGEAGVISHFINKLLQDQAPSIFSYPDEPEGMIRDYVFVNDVVRANLAALGNGANDIYNIGTCVETTTSLLYKTIVWQMGKDIQPNAGQARQGDLRRSMLDSSKAFTDLGWSPIFSLADGIRETIAYFQTHRESS
jgi:UDP-glucose 4-epimerase